MTRNQYWQAVIMRTLAVILLAWPTTYAMAHYLADGDFYWSALIFGCPLLAIGLEASVAKLLPSESGVLSETSEAEVWHAHTVYADELADTGFANAALLRAKLAEAEVEIVPWEDLPQREVA